MLQSVRFHIAWFSRHEDGHWVGVRGAQQVFRGQDTQLLQRIKIGMAGNDHHFQDRAWQLRSRALMACMGSRTGECCVLLRELACGDSGIEVE